MATWIVIWAKRSRASPFTTGDPLDAAAPAYSHPQKAPVCLILYGSALACIVLAWMIGETPGIFIGGGVGLLIALVASAIRHLRVVDQGDELHEMSFFHQGDDSEFVAQRSGQPPAKTNKAKR